MRCWNCNLETQLAGWIINPCFRHCIFVEQAESYYRGLGVDRSYLSSYYWANLASASGARQGEMILSNLHNLARNLTETEFKIWSDAISTVEELTLEDWLGFKVAEKINDE